MGIKGTAMQWAEPYLSIRHQFVPVNKLSCLNTQVNYRVQHSFVLGPILFTLNLIPLGRIIRKHSIHFYCYTDDTHLYLSMKPDNTNQLAKLYVFKT